MSKLWCLLMLIFLIFALITVAISYIFCINIFYCLATLPAGILLNCWSTLKVFTPTMLPPHNFCWMPSRCKNRWHHILICFCLVIGWLFFRSIAFLPALVAFFFVDVMFFNHCLDVFWVFNEHIMVELMWRLFVVLAKSWDQPSHLVVHRYL